LVPDRNNDAGGGLMQKIVVGTDAEAAADLAVSQAAELARSHDAELIVLYVEPPVDAREVFAPSQLPDPDAYLRQIPARFPAIKLRIRRELGDPAKMICAVAVEERADVIVVGNRGIHSRRRRFLGSVPHGVLRGSPCSVFIVDTRRAQ
jgi:nucleotide-binding universal stress UspA family protein